jgi:4-diphosphocytidyl-2-C-methyl-D-erythritol kinase
MLALCARAKLNLGLAVVGRRSDGLHDLASVIVHLDWHDLVAVSPGPQTTVGITGPEATGIPTGPHDNLAGRAAAAAGSPAAIWIEKRIPAQAGLGGGSTDAAAVLRALGHRDPALAAGLGADVPATLAGGSLRVDGTGARLRRLTTPTLHLAVAIAGTSSTAATFAALTASEHHGAGRIDALEHALTAGDALDPLCGSDLEAAAVRANPALGEALARLRTTQSDSRWHLTGSGGAAFALATSAAHAQSLATAARQAGFPARPCRTVTAAP